MSWHLVSRRSRVPPLVFALALVSALASSPEARALNAKSDIGPSLAVIADHTYLIHVGHDNDYIWEARGSSEWPRGWIKDRVHDSGRNAWAFSRNAPDTVVHGDRIYLFYRGHNNDRLWFTRKRVRWEGRLRWGDGFLVMSEHILDAEGDAKTPDTQLLVSLTLER